MRHYLQRGGILSRPTLLLRCQPLSTTSILLADPSSSPTSSSTLGRDVQQQQKKPPSLSLNLNLGSIDFQKVAKATSAAIVTERNLSTQSPSNLSHHKAQHDGGDDEHTAVPTMRSVDVASVPTAMSSSPPPSKSLRELLEDCLLEANWGKGLRLFETALQKSIAAVQKSREAHSLSTTETKEGVAADRTSPSPGVTLRRVLTAEEEQCIPLILEGAAGQVGLGRWSVGHVKNLLQLLFAAEQTDALRRVWTVLRLAGYLEHHLDQYHVCGLIPLARRHQNNIAKITGQSLRSPLSREDEQERVEAWKAIKREYVLDLDAFAKSKGFKLLDLSADLVKKARLAEDIVRGVVPADGADRRQLVDDFQALLARATTLEALDQLLQKMQDLHVAKTHEIYTAVLRNIKEQFRRRAKQHHRDPSPSTQDLVAVAAQYQDRILKELDEYLQQFPSPASRHVQVLNQVLDYFKGVRAPNGAVAPFETALQLLLSPGAPLPTLTTTWDAATTPIQFGEPTMDSKTFELVIRHYHALGFGPLCWVWYDAMLQRGVKGTGVTFHTMLDVATRWSRPTPSVGNNETKKGTAVDRNGALLELYSTMKAQGVDVTNMKTTMNLINAWSSKQVVRRRLR